MQVQCGQSKVAVQQCSWESSEQQCNSAVGRVGEQQCNSAVGTVGSSSATVQWRE